MEFKALKYIYKASGNPEANTLLLLHGTGGDEQDLLRIAEFFGGEVNVLSVRGNVMENGMPRFFKRLSMGVFDEDDVRFRAHELVHFIKEVALKEQFDENKIIALGYSNGANIAGAILMLYPEFLSAAILFRPMQPFQNRNEGLNTTLAQPIFLASGKNDFTVNAEATERYVSLLKEKGYQLISYTLPSGHNLTQEDINLAVKWFKEHFNKVEL